MNTREKKQKALELLAVYTEKQTVQLEAIDARLLEYYTFMLNNSSADPDDEKDFHNLYEVLGALKLLRLFRTYDVDVEKVRQVIRLREGVWHKEGKIWKYDSGGLALPGMRGLTHYRWQPFQVFVLAAMYGCRAWVDTGNLEGERDLLPTEKAENGKISDLRRLCTDFVFFAPRKTDKTGLSAYNNFLFFMLEDSDSEIYCCANSQAQAKLLYDRTQALIRQMDVQEKRIRFTNTMTNWKEGQFRSARLCALSSGGKTKDGLFAQLCCADEFGSAAYVRNKSDMGSLVNVVTSSMGPRREPLLFTSTTAGTINAGPFMEKLDSLKMELEKEIEENYCPPLDVDRRMCLLMQPDEWDLTDDRLFSRMNVRRKVNRMLGIIVQNSFYEQAISESRLDSLKRLETITKLFNVYQNNRVQEWITAEKIRSLQVNMRVDECTAAAGWLVFVGCDFSKGDDLNGMGYLCVNTRTGKFFADTDVWMSAKAVEESPLRELYKSWAAAGWLHIADGATIAPEVIVSRIVELHKKGVNFMRFGYDPYNAKIVVNAIAAWVYSETTNAGNAVDPDQYVIPVKQNFATYNPVVGEFDYLVNRQGEDGALIAFSPNPMWPWQFGNCVLAVSSDGMENRKPVKANNSPGCKVDSIQMLLSALILFDMANGQNY